MTHEVMWIWGGLAAGIVLVAGGLAWSLLSSPLTAGQARDALTKRVQALQRKSPRLAQTRMLVLSPSFSGDFGAAAEQPFHVASMGKLFTTMLITQLVEQGKLRWDSRLVELLPPETLENLFVAGRVDYRDQVTLEHLLAHTSGIGDYFAGPVRGGKPVVEQIALEPQKVWTPQELLEVTRTGQTAHFAPGKGFLYSDSGFVVLGLVVEAVYGKPFVEVVHQRIFGPLGMDHSYFPFRTRPARATAPLSPVWVNGTEFSHSPALSADWAGGGVASTTADLLKFGSALMEGRLVSPETLEYLSQPLNRFERVIRYGRGMMRLRFADFFPLLSAYPDMIGHMGILGTQLFFDPKSKTVVVISLGSTGHMEDSVRLLIEVVGVLRRLGPSSATSTSAG
ncbi:MAG: serine hydrolase domain-containing protein [Meiothermus sp.]|nr:serine hydrolase domain-containing protein [Meiothermus sp.]